MDFQLVSVFASFFLDVVASLKVQQLLFLLFVSKQQLLQQLCLWPKKGEEIYTFELYEVSRTALFTKRHFKMLGTTRNCPLQQSTTAAS